MSEPEPTTAAYILAFREELVAGGIPGDVVHDLIRDASHTLIAESGLLVRRVQS